MDSCGSQAVAMDTGALWGQQSLLTLSFFSCSLTSKYHLKTHRTEQTITSPLREMPQHKLTLLYQALGFHEIKQVFSVTMCIWLELFGYAVYRFFNSQYWNSCGVSICGVSQWNIHHRAISF